MSAQIARDQHFPASCKRCGGVLYDVVDFCPYCGTSRPLDTVALGTLPKATLSALGPTAAAPPVAAAAGLSPADESASDPASAFPDEDSPPARQTPFWEPRRWFSKGFLLVWFVIPIGYAAYQLLGEGSKPAAPVSEPSVHETGGSISQPEQQANVTPPAANTAPAIHETPQFADLNESLQAARASLAENNLSGAAAADNAALARDPNNEDARSIQRDLQAREQRRDNALQIADRCAGEGTWSCTQTEASEALAIDSSSKHAQSLMERSILAKGWTPLGSPNAPKQAANAPATTNSANLASANGNAANRADTPNAAAPASNGNSADAQERAIVQYGWKQAAPTGKAH